MAAAVGGQWPSTLALGLAGQYVSVSIPSGLWSLWKWDDSDIGFTRWSDTYLVGLLAVQLPTTHPVSGSWLLCWEGGKGRWCIGGR